MFFGSQPEYLFGVYNKKKLHCLGRAYPFEKLQVDVVQCPFKLVDNKAEILFAGPIFNSYVISIEEKVSILKSFDEKLTFSKEILLKDTLYTFKVLNEDEKTREVETFKFDEKFPGFTAKGQISVENNKTYFTSKYGKGIILMQSNDIKKETEAMIAKIGSDGITYVEVNSPVERATVTIVKDLNNIKIVENNNIKGILINSSKKIKDSVNVFVKNVYPGSYCFVEDIVAGPAEVQLVEKCDGFYKVKYKDFFGICKDKKVNKVMKGTIFDISGATFKFKQTAEETRSEDFETVSVSKKIKVNSEDDIEGDQYKAIEYIKKKIESGEDDEVHNLFTKHINKIKQNEYLCVFYLQYLITKNKANETQVAKIISKSNSRFPAVASNMIEDKNVIEIIFKKTPTLEGFKKLLQSKEDKIPLMKKNPQYLSYSIDYVYENISNPRVVVESIMDNTFKHWLAYSRKEEGNYKKNLFRRMSKMKFKQNELKQLFKEWEQFELSNGGNTDEVYQLSNEMLQKK